jgi:hypothetical protein
VSFSLNGSVLVSDAHPNQTCLAPAEPVIEPGMDPNEWDPSDPKFQSLTKQLVWAVKTRPAPEATGPVRLSSGLSVPLCNF